MGPFISIGALIAGKVTPSLVLGVFALLRSIVGLHRAQGASGTAIYLKGATVYLMRYCGKDPLDDRTVFGPSIGLTRSGIPRIIPFSWRLAIKAETEWVIKLTLTIFGLYRVLDYPGKLSVKTIVSP